MYWISNPKVRLGLIVNGLYFISLFTPTPQHGRPHLFAHTSERHGDYAVTVQPDVTLQPPSASSPASAYESGGLLHVSLTRDMTLVKRPDRAHVHAAGLRLPQLHRLLEQRDLPGCLPAYYHRRRRDAVA
jgi:hypothetical protein